VVLLTTSPLLQGGPGCSGVGAGYFMEWGPFHLNNFSLNNPIDGVPQLQRNPYSWTTVA
jgi:carboxypeptidase C (cathepsin A)